MSALAVVLAVGGTMRLTRLVTHDYLTERPRRWLQARLPEKLAYLIGCPWCASFWIGAAVAPVVVLWPTNRAVLAALIALTASMVSGLFANLDQPEDFGEPDDSGASG